MSGGLRRTTYTRPILPSASAGKLTRMQPSVCKQSSIRMITKSAGHKIIGESISEFLIGRHFGGRLCSRFVPLAKQNRQ